MKEISLTKGKFAIVDDEDFEYLNQWKWFFKVDGYAARSGKIKRINGKRAYDTIRMHRFIINAPDNMQVDHINGNRLDNRKSNLRLCTKKENSRNCKIYSTNKCGFKGVHFDTQAKKYRAQIRVDRKLITLGYSDSALEASKLYDVACVKYFGNFAKPNQQNG